MTENIETRLNKLESEVEQLKEVHRATDEEGREWTVERLVGQLGLTRRQALYVLGLLAGGSTMLGALAHVTRADSPTGTLYVDQIGTATNPVSNFYVEDEFLVDNTNEVVDVESVITDELSNGSGLTDSQVPVVQQTALVENFERQTLDYFGGSTASYGFSTSTVLAGFASLEATDSGTLRSPFETLRGFRVSVAMFNADGNRQHLALCTDENTTMISNGDGYDFRLTADSDSFQIRRYDSGSGTQVASDDTGTVPTNDWVVMHVDLGYETISATLEQKDGTEIYSLNAADETYPATGGSLFVQFISSISSTSQYYDMITRRPL